MIQPSAIVGAPLTELPPHDELYQPALALGGGIVEELRRPIFEAVPVSDLALPHNPSRCEHSDRFRRIADQTQLASGPCLATDLEVGRTLLGTITSGGLRACRRQEGRWRATAEGSIRNIELLGRSDAENYVAAARRSIATDRHGIPIGWTIEGANRNDSILLAPTLDDVAARGLLIDIETLWLDRGYDSNFTRTRLAEHGIDDAVIAKTSKRNRGASTATKSLPMGLRWPVERTNSWLSNYGQMRRNTDLFTGWLSSLSPSHSSSRRSSSTGGTAGHRIYRLSAEPLSRFRSGRRNRPPSRIVVESLK